MAVRTVDAHAMSTQSRQISRTAGITYACFTRPAGIGVSQGLCSADYQNNLEARSATDPYHGEHVYLINLEDRTHRIITQDLTLVARIL